MQYDKCKIIMTKDSFEKMTMVKKQGMYKVYKHILKKKQEELD